MRSRMLIALGSVSLLLSLHATTQTVDVKPSAITVPVQKDARAVYVLQAAAASLGSSAVADLTLTGRATWSVGSSKEAGPASLSVRGFEESRLDTGSSGGVRAEIHGLRKTAAAASWVDSSGSSHSSSFHNSLTPPVWSAPHALVGLALQSDASAIYMAQESVNGALCDHVRMVRPLRGLRIGDQNTATFLVRLATAELYFDASTHLLLSLQFNLHAEDDAATNIPVEVRYGDYRLESGVLVPHHIQRFAQNTLTFDFTAQTVAVNTGLTDAPFAAQ